MVFLSTEHAYSMERRGGRVRILGKRAEREGSGRPDMLTFLTRETYRYIRNATRMSHTPSLLSLVPSQPTTWVFTLPGILPECAQIHLDSQTRIASVLHLGQEGSAPLLSSCQLTPSSTKIFLALLQAYPQHCSHQTLFAALYPAIEEEDSCLSDQAWSLRPIRRALITLAPALRTFGLEAVSLRGRGYVLTPATPLAGTSL